MQYISRFWITPETSMLEIQAQAACIQNGSSVHHETPWVAVHPSPISFLGVVLLFFDDSLYHGTNAVYFMPYAISVKL